MYNSMHSVTLLMFNVRNVMRDAARKDIIGRRGASEGVV